MLLTSARLRGGLTPALVAGIVGLACSTAHAQNFWGGGGVTNNWTDTLNWNGGPVPTSSNSTTIFFGFSPRLNSNLDIGAVGTPFDLFDLTFNASAGAYVLSGREIRFNGGRLFYNTDSNVTINNNLSAVVAAGPLDIQGNGTGTLTLNGNIVTATTLAKSGAYTLLLGGTNSLSGTVSVGDATTNGGVLGAATNAALGTSTSLALGAGSTFRAIGSFAQTRGISLQGVLGGVLDIPTSITLNHNGAISGTALTKIGAGTLILGSTTNFSGVLSINAGTVQASLASQLGSAAGTISLNNGGRLRITNAFNLSRALTVGVNGGELETTAAGTTNLVTLSGAGALTKTGQGTLNLTGVVGNTISGGMNINGGVVQTAASNSTGTGPLSISNDATLRLNNSWSNNMNITMGAGGGRIDVPAGLATFSGAMGGSKLTKAGAGRLILNAGNSLTGGMHVAEGELTLNGVYSGALLSTAAGTLLSGGREFQGPMQIGGTFGTPGVDTLFTAQSLEALGTSNFKFEFKQEGSPVYVGNGGFPVNDVVRLTGSTPFLAAMAVGSVIDIYLNVTGGLDGSEVFRGGFFTDTNTDFLSQLSAATINVFLRDDAGATAYGGVNYSPLAGATLSTVPDSAGFGLVEGRVLQVGAVPTPGAAAVLGLAGLFAGRRRR